MLIFSHLRTLDSKNPYFSIPALWEPKTQMPENRPENLKNEIVSYLVFLDLVRMFTLAIWMMIA